jgi:hypothetical protein
MFIHLRASFPDKSTEDVWRLMVENFGDTDDQLGGGTIKFVRILKRYRMFLKDLIGDWQVPDADVDRFSSEFRKIGTLSP